MMQKEVARYRAGHVRLLSVGLAIFGLLAAGSVLQAADVTPEEAPEKVPVLPDAGIFAKVFGSSQKGYVPRPNVLMIYNEWRWWGYHGEHLIPLAKGWMEAKRYVGIKMHCNSKEQLPPEIRDKIPSAKVQWGGSEVGGNNVPEYPFYWSDEYLAAHREWVEAVADALKDDPYLAFVGICGMAAWNNDMFIFPDDLGSPKLYEPYGYDTEGRDKLYYGLVDAYLANFPGIQLYIAGVAGQTSDPEKFNRYLMDNGIGLRGLALCGEILGIAMHGGKGPVYEGQDTAYLQWPIRATGGFSTMEWELDQPKWETPKILEKSLEYGFLSFQYADGDSHARRLEADPVKKALLDDYEKKLGYRIAVTRARYPDSVAPGSPLRLDLDVCNRGMARMYWEREMEVSFLSVSSTHEVRGEARAMPEPPTDEWQRWSTNAVTLTVKVPREVQRGVYDVAIALLDHAANRPGFRIPLVMKEQTADDRYILGRISVK